MLVALYLTTLRSPILYGVEVIRVIEADTIKVAVAKSDVFITDTAFDTTNVPIKQCCVLRGEKGIEAFAKENGYDCIDVENTVEWFSTRLGLDVSRRARQNPQGVPVSKQTVAPTTTNGAKFKAMYEGLVSEVRKADLFKNLDPNDAKTYDILLQTVRGTIRKADSVAGDMTKVQTKLFKVESELAELTSQKHTNEENIDAVLSGLTQAVSDCTNVLTQITEMTDDPELVLFSGVSVQASAALGLASKFQSVTDARELRAVGSVMREFVSCVAGIMDGVLSLGTKAVKASSGAQDASHKAAMAKAGAERVVQQVEAQYEQEKEVSANLRQQLTQLNTMYQEQLSKTMEIENQLLLSGGATVPALQEQLRSLRYELQNKANQIARMEDAAANVVDDSQDSLAPEVANGIIRQLRTQVSSLKLERDRATAELLKAKKETLRESERAETLTNSAKSLSQVALRGSQVSALPPFKYTAKAIILPVFGNGSAGITSSALSLARTLGLNSKTVLLDFDLVSTDLEGRFKNPVNPIITVENEPVSGKHTAMGLFVEKGKDYFASHYAELVVRIDSNKAGILDYLPGFYSKPDLFMLTQADYTMLLNYLGSRYEYIVIDAGKIGCSEIGDQLIRNFSLCAFRTLIVTDSSKGKVRAMRLKLNDVFGTETRSVIEHSVWLTNRALKRDDLTSFTTPATSIMLPILNEMVGVHESFHITQGAQREFKKVVRALAGV